MKTTRSLKNIFLIPLLILILGLMLVNCGDGDDDYYQGDDFKLYETGTFWNNTPKSGQSVALSGNWAVSSHGDAAGAYMTFYEYSGVTWVSNVTKIFTDVTSPIYNPVSIDGNYAVMGSVNGTDSSVVLYTNAGVYWELGAIISSNGQFGASIGISGGNVIVGAPVDNTVYFYDVSNNWFDLKGSFSTNVIDAEFGYSVGIDGNYAIVGAYGTNNTSGSAYIYKHNGTDWTLDQELSNPGPYSNYGLSVAICGNNAIVGVNDTNAMAVIFHNDGDNWTAVHTIRGTDQINGFVTATISSNYAVAGRINGDAYLRFSKNNNGSWNEIGDDVHLGSGFSINTMGLAMDDYRLIVGEPQAAGGWVHFYE